MDLDGNSTPLFDDLVTGHDNDTSFISGNNGCVGYSEPLRMAFTDAVIQCGGVPFRHGDSPSLVAKDAANPAHENLSNHSYDGDMSLPLLDDFRLDERDIASKFVGSGGQSGWRARIGKRTSSDKGKPGKCKVCGDLATGMYFGALVCVPCKTFFLRYEGDNFNFVCKGNKDCEITMATRTQCKFCRYQKCREAGMVRRVRPAHVNLNEGQQLCVVCHDVANGIHFGAVTCEGCKKFFRRGLSEHSQYSCKNGQVCVINPRTRNSCRFCRYKTCLSVGMSREAIQMGRPSKLAMESSRIQRGTRAMNTDSGIVHDEKNHQLETPTGSAKDAIPHYLLINHHPKEEPSAWEWQMADQPVLNHSAQPDAGNFAGHMTGVCDFLDSPARHIGMEEYNSLHPGSGLLTALNGTNGGGDQISSGGSLSHLRNISPEAIHYGNGRWGEVNIDVSKQGTVQLDVLNGLCHNNGVGVHQMNVSSYAPRIANGNIPLTVNGVVSSDLIQFPTNVLGMHQSLKPNHLDPTQPLRLDHFNLPQSSSKMDSNCQKTGQLQHYGNVLESLLDGSCQTQEVCSKQQCFGLKYNSGGNCINASSDQQITSTNRINSETNRDCGFENVRPAGDGSAQFMTGRSSSQSEKMTGGSGCYQGGNETTSAAAVLSLQSQQQGHVGYLHFDSSPSTEPSSTSKTVSTQCATPPRVPKSNVSPTATRPVRDDAVVPMMMMSNETKNSMDSIAEWVFQLQQSFADGKEEETPTVFLNEDLIKICRELYVDGIPFEQQIEKSIKYWKSQELPDENIMVGAEHWRLFNHFHPLYANYVSMGSTMNHNLRIKFEQWKDAKRNATVDETMTWVKENVFPAYTDISRSYFTQIQGFKSFNVHDQRILLRLAQSQSRILAAALAWFNSDSQTFTDFLPWRKLDPGQVDLFKDLLTDYAENVRNRNLDPVESALFNIVVVIATDYPGLVRPDVIESYRTQFLATFRAYTTAKYGTPNKRMEKLFQIVPQLRRLGHLHYAMTQDPNIGITTNSTSKAM